METVKLIIINGGDYKTITKKINCYLFEYDYSYIRLDINYLKETISDGLDYQKNALFDKIEEDIIKDVLLSGFNLILVALDRPEKYYKNLEKMIKGYEHLIDVKIEYKKIPEKENIIKKIMKRIIY